MCTYLDHSMKQSGFSDEILISIQQLAKHYTVKKDLLSSKTVIKAVNSISFDIYKGETLGLIGESGSGKTTTGELIMRLIKPDTGKILYKGIDLTKIEASQMRKLRKDIQIIFQQGKETLDPKATVEELIGAPLRLHRVVRNEDLENEIGRLLNMVGLAAKDRYKFSYQLSGGQQQRVGIARAIASRPSFVVCDEPVSALDVSVQGQILNLLMDLKKELDLTYLFISHDLKVVQHICDRIAVMYKGEVIEIGNTDKIIFEQKHDYTRQLILSML